MHWDDMAIRATLIVRACRALRKTPHSKKRRD